MSTGSKNSPGVAANLFSYDGENRMLTANIGGMGNVTYVYDGEGRRVQKTVGAVVTSYIYDGGGQLVAEYSNGLPSATGTEYLFDDHLGSTRLVVNGSTVKRYDYLPFGEELPSGVDGRGSDYGGQVVAPSSPDVVSQKFTSKERDAETGLDSFGPRYLSSAQGRFTSPDEPFSWADPENPRSWNLYAYSSNNPLLYSDPTGHEPCENGVNPENGNICTVVVLPKPKEQPIITKADLNPLDNGPPLAFQGFVNLFLNGQVKRGSAQLALGILPSALLSFGAARLGGTAFVPRLPGCGRCGTCGKGPECDDSI